MFSFFTMLVALHPSVRSMKLCTQMILMVPLFLLIKLECWEEDWQCGWTLANLGTEHTDKSFPILIMWGFYLRGKLHAGTK